MNEEEWTVKRKKICDMITNNKQTIKHLKEELATLDSEFLIALHNKHR